MILRVALAVGAAVFPLLQSPSLPPWRDRPPGPDTKLTYSIDEGDVVVQTRAGEPFAVLRLKDARIPHVWPLVGPAGDEMTRAFPMSDDRAAEEHDHPHHQSFWYTHGDVNGHDFWHDPKCRIVPVSKPHVRMETGRFLIEATMFLDWIAPDGTKLLNELRFYRFGLRDGARLVECESSIVASQDVVFGDTKEGSFALRLRPELRLKGKAAAGTILNSRGDTDGDCWGKRAAWVSYEAPLEDHRVGVAVMDHRDNLRHPTWWHARDYGLLAANPFGIHDFEKKEAGLGDFKLAKGESLQQKYLVVLSAGQPGDEAAAKDKPNLTAEELAAIWAWWTE